MGLADLVGPGACRGCRRRRPHLRGDRPGRRAGPGADRPEAAGRRLRARAGRGGVRPGGRRGLRAARDRGPVARRGPGRGGTRRRPRPGAAASAERTALNFLGHLSGIATLTARFVDAVRGSGATILDTRKTTPGLRELEKAAVVAGGGQNHRLGLDDAILIKENHIALAGGLGAGGRRRSRAAHPELRGRGRVPRPRRGRRGARRGRRPAAARQHERRRACASGGRATRRAEPAGGVRLEASGGVTLANVAEIAATGVDLISVGALTHSAPALDLSMLER